MCFNGGDKTHGKSDLVYKGDNINLSIFLWHFTLLTDVCGLELSIQYHSAFQAWYETPGSGPVQLPLQLDPGLPVRQTPGGQNWHLLPADPQHLNPAGLCPQPFSLYTYDFRATNSFSVTFKFMNDTVVVSLITRLQEEVCSLTQ